MTMGVPWIGIQSINRNKVVDVSPIRGANQRLSIRINSQSMITNCRIQDQEHLF